MGKFGDVLAEKRVTLSWLVNSNMAKLEKFDHLHLVYHFTVSLRSIHIVFWNIGYVIKQIIWNTVIINKSQDTFSVVYNEREREYKTKITFQKLMDLFVMA